MTARRARAVAAAAAAVTAVASLVPVDVTEARIPTVAGVRADHLAHLVGYAAFAGAFAEPLADGRSRESAAAGGFAAATLFGTALEALQPRVGRTAERGDLAAHVVGAAAGALAWAVLRGQRAGPEGEAGGAENHRGP